MIWSDSWKWHTCSKEILLDMCVFTFYRSGAKLVWANIAEMALLFHAIQRYTALVQENGMKYPVFEQAVKRITVSV